MLILVAALIFVGLFKPIKCAKAHSSNVSEREEKEVTDVWSEEGKKRKRER